MSGQKSFIHVHSQYETFPEALLELGMEGYGIYNRLLELLSKDPDLRLPIKDIPRWAADMGVSIMTLTRFIHRAIDEAFLSTTDDEKSLYSPWLTLHARNRGSSREKDGAKVLRPKRHLSVGGANGAFFPTAWQPSGTSFDYADPEIKGLYLTLQEAGMGNCPTWAEVEAWPVGVIGQVQEWLAGREGAVPEVIQGFAWTGGV